MDKRDLVKGEIVQLSPETCKNPMFRGCLMIVSEPKAFGAQGYVQALGKNQEPGGQAFYRAGWDEMEFTGGSAPWLTGSATESGHEGNSRDKRIKKDCGRSR